MEIPKKYALALPDILLPAKDIDLLAWAVVACDQYTQDEEYWQKVAGIAQGKPSALHIILPEIYLNDFSPDEKQKCTAKIKRTMNEYLTTGVFSPPLHACIYTERKTAYGRLRRGLVCCIDLEEYDWRPEKKAKIRATEATILERIPPRVSIRRDAPLESPHVMLLVNDPEKRLVERTGTIVKESGQVPVYSTDLMMGAGHICGRAVSDEKALSNIGKSLAALECDNKACDGSVFMFAVGDGNHSLATAKTVWEELKRNAGGVEREAGRFSVPENLENHPSRFALVEIVNLYDSGLTFEPIHRVLFGTDANELTSFVRSKLGGELVVYENAEDLTFAVEKSVSYFGFVSLQSGFVCLKTKTDCLAVSALQPVLDEYIQSKVSCNSCAKKTIDYIHGTEEVFRLAKRKDTVSVMLPPIAKDSFFATIETYGSLPRKSFSIGEASEKRFYLECRKLK